MSVRQAVSRAMRSGRVVIPGEFEAIQTEALASVDITQLHTGDYLFRGEDAAALASARFRNDGERREFFTSLLYLARDRVLAQISAALAGVPAAEMASRLGCRSETRGAGAASSSTPEVCFGDRDGTRVIFGGVCTASDPATCHVSGLLAFLGNLLPSNAFIGIPESTHAGDLAGIQLLDGVLFTRENFRESALPRETQISAAMLQALVRARLCTEGASLPDCR